jgi:hypothetical protein
VEVWLAPDGGTAWHIHTRQSEDFDTMAGGDPVLGRKDKSGRVYSFNASIHPFWIQSNFKSVEAHFDAEPIFLGADTDIEHQLPRTRTCGALCQKDEIAIRERDRILALLDEQRQLGHIISMDLLFDARFLAKLAVALGFNLLGSNFDKLKYTARLRKLLWTRRTNLDSSAHEVRMVTYFAGLNDTSLKMFAVPVGFVFMLMALKEGLVLRIVFPSGHSVQVSITDSGQDADTSALLVDFRNRVFVSVPQIRQIIGPIGLPEYVAWKAGSHKIDELDRLIASVSQRTALPALR